MAYKKISWFKPNTAYIDHYDNNGGWLYQKRINTEINQLEREAYKFGHIPTIVEYNADNNIIDIVSYDENGCRYRGGGKGLPCAVSYNDSGEIYLQSFVIGDRIVTEKY